MVVSWGLPRSDSRHTRLLPGRRTTVPRMTVRRSTVSLRREEAMRVSRVAVGHAKLVYVVVADKKLNYPKGRSRIAYFGTTKNGVSRVAQSAAYRTDEIFRKRGVRSFTVHLVTCRPRQRVKMWVKLERAFLLAFRDQFGAVPACNSHGKGITGLDEFEYFARTKIDRLIADLS